MILHLSITGRGSLTDPTRSDGCLLLVRIQRILSYISSGLIRLSSGNEIKYILGGGVVIFDVDSLHARGNKYIDWALPKRRIFNLRFITNQGLRYKYRYTWGLRKSILFALILLLKMTRASMKIFKIYIYFFRHWSFHEYLVNGKYWQYLGMAPYTFF